MTCSKGNSEETFLHIEVLLTVQIREKQQKFKACCYQHSAADLVTITGIALKTYVHPAFVGLSTGIQYHGQ